MTTHKATLASPLRRTDGITERAVGHELLLHDAGSDRVTALDAESTAVWQSCDGSHSIERIAAETGQSVEEVAGRLAALDDAGLLERAGMSRRRLLLRAGVVGAVLPIGTSILLPQAAAAASSLAFLNSFSCTGTGNKTLTLTINLSGGTPYFYGAFVYSDAGLTNQLGYDYELVSGTGTLTFTVALGTAETGGATLYVKITHNLGGTDTVYQVKIPTTGLGSCT